MMEKNNFLPLSAFWLLIGCGILQVSCGSYELRYKPVIFDDQYIGCSDELSDDLMPKILTKEKSNQQFNTAWKNATKRWREMKFGLPLPDEFEDEHGIALLVFTSQHPKGNPIHQQLNGNLTIAGASRKAYMDKFHFKALHYYLTRALQILKPDCSETYTTYRGSQDTFRVFPVFKFGRFTSTSLNSSAALEFGRASHFSITTCFGASIADFSFFPDELEVLIPAAEKFTYVKKEGSIYYLKSTGQMCSYFNCAIMGAEKQDEAVCYPGSEVKSKTGPASLAELEERIAALEELMVGHLHEWNIYIMLNHETTLQMSQLVAAVSAFSQLAKETKSNTELLRSILQTDTTKITDFSLILFETVITLKKRVRDLEGFIWIIIIGFTIFAGIKVYSLIKNFVLAAEVLLTRTAPNQALAEGEGG